MSFYLWSNHKIIMYCMCASRTVHIYWWLSDYYSIEKTVYPPSGHALVDLMHLVLGQIVASLLSLCMAKWLRKWRRGWLYVRSKKKKKTRRLKWLFKTTHIMFPYILTVTKGKTWSVGGPDLTHGLPFENS